MFFDFRLYFKATKTNNNKNHIVPKTEKQII